MIWWFEIIQTNVKLKVLFKSTVDPLNQAGVMYTFSIVRDICIKG